MEPNVGEILVDGVPLRILGNEAFRRSIGGVMQDDKLLSGSIAAAPRRLVLHDGELHEWPERLLAA